MSSLVLLGACTAVLDVDGYSFVDDAGVQQTPGLPLEPERDAGGPTPTRPPVVPPTPGGGRPVADPEPDAAAPPVVEPPAEPSRDVVVDAPEPLLALAGSPTGGSPRTATCPGAVIKGIVFQYWTDIGLQPNAVSYVWPLCVRLVPGATGLVEGEEVFPTWLLSEPTDPVFVDERANEGIDGIVCPDGQYVVGIEGSYDEGITPSVAFRSLGIRCAGLGADPERSEVIHSAVSVAGLSVAPTAGAVPFAQQCPEGRAGNQIDLRFGDWLDAVGLSCSVVRWPFSAGHTCASPRECQSGNCGADGLCVP